MTGGLPDWAHVEAAIRAGDLVKLEEYAEMLEGFPAGSDPEMGPWICMFAGGPLAALRWALDRGAPVDPEVDDGFPPLHAALDAGGPGVCARLSLLIAAGADLGRHGFNDWTPLHMAAAKGNLDAVRLLLDAGADRSIRTRIDDCATAEEEARILGQTAAADLIRDWRAGGTREP
jgi:ankyrin repeat protein